MSERIDGLPDDAGDARDVDITFNPDDFGIEVVATLGEASIVVEHSWEGGAEDAATLVQALPNILMAVQEALDQQEAT